MASDVYECAQVWHGFWRGFGFPSIYFMAHSRCFVVLVLILGLFVNLSLIELIAFYQPKCNLCRSRKQIHSMQTCRFVHVLSFFFRSLFILSSLTLSLGSDRAHLMHSRQKDYHFLSPMPYIFNTLNQITSDTTAMTTVTGNREKKDKTHIHRLNCSTNKNRINQGWW